MSDALKHECGVAMLRLLKPLEFYKEKYVSALPPLQAHLADYYNLNLTRKSPSGSSGPPGQFSLSFLIKNNYFLFKIKFNHPLKISSFNDPFDFSLKIFGIGHSGV